MLLVRCFQGKTICLKTQATSLRLSKPGLDLLVLHQHVSRCLTSLTNVPKSIYPGGPWPLLELYSTCMKRDPLENISICVQIILKTYLQFWELRVWQLPRRILYPNSARNLCSLSSNIPWTPELSCGIWPMRVHVSRMRQHIWNSQYTWVESHLCSDERDRAGQPVWVLETSLTLWT